ncbi:MAG: hypothetical protein IPP96_15920 [Chitinophagaceae bacterium]|nr:hypothetical protein [Chitinophagaceae bacterium]
MEFGGDTGGHIVGHSPHEQPDDPADLGLDVHPDNHSSIFLPDNRETKGIGYWKFNLWTG